MAKGSGGTRGSGAGNKPAAPTGGGSREKKIFRASQIPSDIKFEASVNSYYGNPYAVSERDKFVDIVNNFNTAAEKQRDFVVRKALSSKALDDSLARAFTDETKTQVYNTRVERAKEGTKISFNSADMVSKATSQVKPSTSLVERQSGLIKKELKKYGIQADVTSDIKYEAPISQEYVHQKGGYSITYYIKKPRRK